MIKREAETSAWPYARAYLQFYLFRREGGTAGSGRSFDLFLAAKASVQFIVAIAAVITAKKGRFQSIVVSSGDVVVRDGRVSDPKIDHHIASLPSPRLLVGNFKGKGLLPWHKSGDVVIPLVFFESVLLPIVMIIGPRYSSVKELTIRGGVKTNLYLWLKLCTKFSKRIFISLLFGRLRFSTLIVNDGYAENVELIHWANGKGLKTVEVQHGVITRGHYAYSGANALDSQFYPREFVAWDRKAAEIMKWRRNTNFRFSEIARTYKHENSLDTDIIIIGQPSIQAALIDLFFELSAEFGSKVKYRPHPRERQGNLPNRQSVVISQTSIFVGGFSTLMIELCKFTTSDVYCYLPLVPPGYHESLESAGVLLFDDSSKLRDAIIDRLKATKTGSARSDPHSYRKIFACKKVK